MDLVESIDTRVARIETALLGSRKLDDPYTRSPGIIEHQETLAKDQQFTLKILKYGVIPILVVNTMILIGAGNALPIIAKVLAAFIGH